MSARRLRYLDLALKVCSDRHRSGGAVRVKMTGEQRPDYNMTAVIVKGSKVISIGTNKYKPIVNETVARNYPNSCSVHAEIAAILGVPSTNPRSKIETDKFKGCELYVAGLTKSGNLLLSKPCKHCQSILASLPFKAIYYHDKSGELKELKL